MLTLGGCTRSTTLSGRCRCMGAPCAACRCPRTPCCDRSAGPTRRSSMTPIALDAESTSRIADVAGLGVRYHDSGPAASGLDGTGRGNADTVVLLHGGGPGASAWSNFGRTMPVIASRFRVVMMDLPGYGGSAARPDGALLHHRRRCAGRLAGPARHREGAPDRQLSRWRYGTAVRAELPRTRGAPRPDGAGRADAERFLARPDRGGAQAH